MRQDIQIDLRKYGLKSFNKALEQALNLETTLEMPEALLNQISAVTNNKIIEKLQQLALKEVAVYNVQQMEPVLLNNVNNACGICSKSNHSTDECFYNGMTHQRYKLK